MIEEMQKILDRFDKETIEYLEMNKSTIFRSIAENQGMPIDIGATLVGRNNKRDVIIKSIGELKGLTKPD